MDGRLRSCRHAVRFTWFAFERRALQANHSLPLRQMRAAGVYPPDLRDAGAPISTLQIARCYDRPFLRPPEWVGGGRIVKPVPLDRRKAQHG